MSKRLTTTTFIAKATAVHGNKYDYSQVIYIKSQIKVKIICPKHALFEQRPAEHLAGKGCDGCGRAKAAQKRHLDTAEFVRRAEATHGQTYDYSETVYRNSRTKVKIRCREHGIFSQVATEHLVGKGCRKCAGCEPKNDADYHQVAVDSGFTWIGPSVPNTGSKTGWRCQYGHEWQTVYDSLKQGTGCPYCAGSALKIDKDYHLLAKERGIKWLGKKVINTQTKTRWECSCGYRWRTSYNKILQGTNCPKCAGNLRLTKESYYQLAESRGFEWLGENLPQNNLIKTGWCCGEGHEWEAPYGSIQQGIGCPYCANRVMKSSEDYHLLAKEKGFEWISETPPQYVRHHTQWLCNSGHKWIAPYNSLQQGYGCPKCAGREPKTSDDYHLLAAERGFIWLGPKVENVSVKTEWECGGGHRWKIGYAVIFTGHGCPYCAGNVRKRKEDYYNLAQSRGFRWLGPEVNNSSTNTFWLCSKGHKWESSYSSIRAGSGCHICVDIVNGSLVSKPQRELANILGGELNFIFKGRRIYIALDIDGVAIAIEYDGWYWHGHKQDEDAARDLELQEAGYAILRIKSNNMLPDNGRLAEAIEQLLGGEKYVEIVLDDWGVGPTQSVLVTIKENELEE